MLKMVFAASQLTATSTGQQRVFTALETYYLCVSRTAQRLGLENGSAPTTIVRVAEAACSDSWASLRQAWLGNTTESAEDGRRFAHWRRSSADAAIQDVMDARRDAGDSPMGWAKK